MLGPAHTSLWLFTVKRKHSTFRLLLGKSGKHHNKISGANLKKGVVPTKHTLVDKHRVAASVLIACQLHLVLTLSGEEIGKCNDFFLDPLQTRDRSNWKEEQQILKEIKKTSQEHWTSCWRQGRQDQSVSNETTPIITIHGTTNHIGLLHWRSLNAECT